MGRRELEDGKKSAAGAGRSFCGSPPAPGRFC